MSDSQVPIGKLIHLAAAIRSTVGEFLNRVESAGNFIFELDTPAYYRLQRQRIPGDEVFNAELCVEFDCQTIDLRQDVPAQVSQQLLAWSRQLAQIANEVKSVKPEPLNVDALAFSMKAYNVVNMVTGDTVEGGPFYDLAFDELHELSESTGQPYEIKVSKLDEWPESNEMFAALVGGAIERASKATRDGVSKSGR